MEKKIRKKKLEKKMKKKKKKKRTRTWSTTQHIRKHPKKGREIPTSGCGCAHPREPLRGHVTFGHFGSHGTCTTVLLL